MLYENYPGGHSRDTNKSGNLKREISLLSARAPLNEYRRSHRRERVLSWNKTFSDMTQGYLFKPTDSLLRLLRSRLLKKMPTQSHSYFALKSAPTINLRPTTARGRAHEAETVTINELNAAESLQDTRPSPRRTGGRVLLAGGQGVAHRREGRWIRTQSSSHPWVLTRVRKEAGQGGPTYNVTSTSTQQTGAERRATHRC